MSEITSPNKRVASEEVPEIVETKKSKPESKTTAVEEADEEPEEDVVKELKHLDPSNIIEGRRTRGKKIDYTKLEQPDEDEEDEEDQDAVPEDEPEEESEEEYEE